MDKKIYKLPFTTKSSIKWKCPTCSMGFLKFKKNTFKTGETAESKKKDQPHWDTDWIRATYSCLFECSNHECGEIVASAGRSSVDMIVNPEDDSVVEVISCIPQYFTPHLRMFNYSSDVPEDICAEIEKSFELFFCDANSSANHMRTALENLLTYIEDPRFKEKNGRQYRLNLHERIELLPSKYNHIKDLFFAIKWNGNEGSHSGDIAIDDVLDMYEIMDEILQKIFRENTKRIKKIAQEINKCKGPRKYHKSSND